MLVAQIADDLRMSLEQIESEETRRVLKARRPARLMRAGYSNYPAMHQA